MGIGGIAPQFLTSALEGNESSASRLGRFTTAEIAHGTHWRGGWVGPRAGLDTVEKRAAVAVLKFKPGICNTDGNYKNRRVTLGITFGECLSPVSSQYCHVY
jgi:hypothetical protein